MRDSRGTIYHVWRGNVYFRAPGYSAFSSTAAISKPSVNRRYSKSTKPNYRASNKKQHYKLSSSQEHYSCDFPHFCGNHNMSSVIQTHQNCSSQTLINRLDHHGSTTLIDQCLICSIKFRQRIWSIWLTNPLPTLGGGLRKWKDWSNSHVF